MDADKYKNVKPDYSFAEEVERNKENTIGIVKKAPAPAAPAAATATAAPASPEAPQPNPEAPKQSTP